MIIHSECQVVSIIWDLKRENNPDLAVAIELLQTEYLKYRWELREGESIDIQYIDLLINDI